MQHGRQSLAVAFYLLNGLRLVYRGEYIRNLKKLKHTVEESRGNFFSLSEGSVFGDL